MEWQPIDSAPKDGTEIILAISGADPNRKWVHIGWWEEGGSFPWRFIDTFSLEPTGCCEDEDGDRCPVNGVKAESVTHWQPLPEPPAISRATASPPASPEANATTSVDGDGAGLGER